MSQTHIEQLVKSAKIAQKSIRDYSQAQLDELTHAVAWTVIQPENNKWLSEMAVAETQLGKVEDKIIKNHRKTLGLLRDLKNAKSTGILDENSATGITTIARPIGVIGSLVPSTNPIATPINNIINALKCGNSIIVSPSPKGAKVFAEVLALIHQAFSKLGAPKALVQALPYPPNKADTQQLMQLVDLVIVTGSQNNVRGAYTSGTPAIGVGTGNVTTIVDESADIETVAKKIRASKTFDHATSCSSENNVLCLASVYDKLLAALQNEGGSLLNANEVAQLTDTFVPSGKLNAQLIAKSAQVIAQASGVAVDPNTEFLMVESAETSTSNPFARERMAPILTLFKATDFAHAKKLAHELLDNQGAGHSVGIHTNDPDQCYALGHELPTCRVIVNQAHCFATGGAFNNGMPFSLSMGCGSWGGNSIDENLNYKHFMNVTKIVREIPPQEPTVDAILGAYIKKHDQA